MRSWRNKSARSAVVASSIALFAGTVGWPAGAASAQSPSGSAAVITPLLDMLDFGDNTGLPLACDDTASLLSNQSAASSIAVELVTECQALSQLGDGYLQQAIAESDGLTFINPSLDPAIAQLASELQNVGNNYGPSLSPFGPTVAGLGGTVAYYEGS
jgi:hypothetical protein